MTSTIPSDVPGCDSDEEVFWGPITAREIEIDWRRLKAQSKRFLENDEKNISESSNREVSITLTPIQHKIACSKDLPLDNTLIPRVIDCEDFVEVNLNISSPEDGMSGYEKPPALINRSIKNEADENKKPIAVESPGSSPIQLSRRALEGMIPESSNDVSLYTELMLVDNEKKTQEINDHSQNNENIVVESLESPPIEISSRALEGMIPESSNEVRLYNELISVDKGTKPLEINNESENKENIEYPESFSMELASRALEETIPESSSFDVSECDKVTIVEEEIKSQQINDESENKENIPVESPESFSMELASRALEETIPESSFDVNVCGKVMIVEEETKSQQINDESENKENIPVESLESFPMELASRALEDTIPEPSFDVSVCDKVTIVEEEIKSHQINDESEKTENIPVECPESFSMELASRALQDTIPESSFDVNVCGKVMIVEEETKSHQINDESEKKENIPVECPESFSMELASRAIEETIPESSFDMSVCDKVMTVKEETKSQRIIDVSLGTQEIASELIEELKTKVESIDLCNSSVQVSSEQVILSPDLPPEVTSSGLMDTPSEEQTDSSELSFESLAGDKDFTDKPEDVTAYIPPDKKQKYDEPVKNQENVDPNNKSLPRKSKIPASGSSKLPILKPSSLKVERYVADTVWAAEFRKKKIPKPKKPDYVVSPAKLGGLLKSTPLRPSPLEARPQSAGPLYRKPSSAPLQQNSRVFNTPNIPSKPSSAISRLKTPTPVSKTPSKLKRETPSSMTTPPKNQKYKSVPSPVADYINSSKPIIIRNVTPSKAGLQMPQRILNMESENVGPKAGGTGIPQKYYSSASKVIVQSSPKKSPVQLRLGERQASVLVTPKPQVYKHTGRVQSEEKKKIQESSVQDRLKPSRETSLHNTSFGTLQLSKNNELDMSVLEKQ